MRMIGHQLKGIDIQTEFNCRKSDTGHSLAIILFGHKQQSAFKAVKAQVIITLREGFVFLP